MPYYRDSWDNSEGTCLCCGEEFGDYLDRNEMKNEFRQHVCDENEMKKYLAKQKELREICGE